MTESMNEELLSPAAPTSLGSVEVPARNDATEELVQQALEEVLASGLKPNGQPVLSLRQAALKYNVGHGKLTGRWNGRKTRVESHIHLQILTPSQELVLKSWTKVLAKRGIGLSQPMLAEYASLISNKPVSIKWVQAFKLRHPDLTVRWTTGLEACRAKALNETQVNGFFNLLKEVVDEYKIEAWNIWNMDEKGVQMGVGKRTLVLVDRDQKTVHHIENGDRELVTVIEAVSADGVALRPSVIFKGKRRDLAWARVNPSNASISVSPNGWTDNDLGLKWLMYDFHPESKKHTRSESEWRLLILDGHNSHCSYPFVDFCEKHKIIVICLTAHTTHALQPCDVGVFGPLASSWKAEVNNLSRRHISITKYNFLETYGLARDRVLTLETIKSSFRKTGIFPFNPSVIPQSAFAPAMNTTTQAAQPVSATLPTLLQPISLVSASPEATQDEHPRAAYTLIDFPSPIRRNSSRAAYIAENQRLRKFALKAKAQMEADYALNKLMDAENARLRADLYTKKKAPRKREGGSGARHMTGADMMEALARADWEAKMNELFAQGAPIFKERKAYIVEKAKEEKKKKAQDERAAAAAVRVREREEKKRIEEEEKAQKKREKDERKRIADEKKAAIEAERKAKAAARKVAAEEKRLQVAERKAASEAKKLAAAAKKAEEERKKSERPKRSTRQLTLQASPTRSNDSGSDYTVSPQPTNLSSPPLSNNQVTVVDISPTKASAAQSKQLPKPIPIQKSAAQAPRRLLTIQEEDELFIIRRSSCRLANPRG